MNTLGHFCKKTRKQQRLSQAEVAKAAGLDPSYISSIENGEVNLSVKAILGLAKGLRVSPVTIFDLAVGSKPIADKELIQLAERMRNLPPEKQTALLEMVNAVLRQFESQNE